MTDGAHTPRIQTHPDQPANLTDHTAGSEPAPAKPCQPPVTSRQIGPLAQAERRPGEFLRLASLHQITNEQIQDLAALQSAFAAVEAEHQRAERETLRKEVQERTARYLRCLRQAALRKIARVHDRITPDRSNLRCPPVANPQGSQSDGW